MKKERYFSNSPWEKVFGYCRAVRVGDIIEVSGTTAVDDNAEVVSEDDYYGQTVYVLRKIEKAIIALGGTRADITRTRIYIKDISQWTLVAKAHSEFFVDGVPVTSLIEIPRLIDPRLLVEIEVTARLVENQ